ncbi:aminodeoxychorismate synthase component I [Methylocella sp. CPCC 101449]|uniref:aminodeoxychorismate synthase component I n=1 Tax=Methylocella sp. CPCC 101449 TaxID=2987531 RepID=UPI002890EA3B|nr:aminodeoxychorismate synthase component I [Methylocella sp. CPCC 101449]MDT2020454.1 aminodeoxychorismate synthase component I [Methylocella sp. CPCC 101449]
MRTLIIDNYDSFTHNLVHLVAVVNQEMPLVLRNDACDWASLRAMAFDNVIISPGPGHPGRPGDFGVCADVLSHCEKPILGVCLGHQGIATMAGGAVIPAPRPVHGKATPVRHTGTGLLQGLPSPFLAARYHSLTVQRPLPGDLIEIAWSDDDLVMALMHRARPLWGVQFHPESIICEGGDRLLRNFRDLSQAAAPRSLHPVSHFVPEKAKAKQQVSLAWAEIIDPPSPETAYTNAFAAKECAFWLDSAAEQSQARWSYFGEASALDLYKAKSEDKETPGILDLLAHRLPAEIDNSPPCPFVGGWIGWFGYELARDFGGATHGISTMPDALLQHVDRFLAFDHETGKMYAVCTVEQGQEAQTWLSEIETAIRQQAVPQSAPHAQDRIMSFRLDRDRDTYLRDVEQCLDWIHAGESYQICLTNTIRTELDIESFDLYRVLRRINPAPFAAYIKWPGGAVLSASPERFLHVDKNGHVEAKPIKGTVKRDADPIGDRKLATELAHSDKDRAENVMIVDLLRNDLSRVCRPGTVTVPKLCDIESYATVHQLVSTVHGQLEPNKTIVDLLRAAFPGGSMTGAPKTRTLALIDQLEGRARGVYSGALGWIGYDGAADLSIVIRTIVQAGRELSIGVGGGVVAQSTPQREFDEMLLKAKASIQAIVTAATGSFDENAFIIEGAEEDHQTNEVDNDDLLLAQRTSS